MEYQVQKFQGQDVKVYEINGEFWIAGKDITKILQLSREDAASQIYRRNKEEFKSFIQTLNLRGSKNARHSYLFNETGCHLIAMFSRSPRGKEMRRWLAELPRKAREAQGKQEEIIAYLLQRLERLEKMLENPERLRLPGPPVQQYRRAKLFQEFLEDCCNVEEGAEVLTGYLYAAYKLYCQGKGQSPSSQKTLGMSLGRTNFFKDKTTNGRRLWRGLALKEKYHRLAKKKLITLKGVKETPVDYRRLIKETVQETMKTIMEREYKNQIQEVHARSERLETISEQALRERVRQIVNDEYGE